MTSQPDNEDRKEPTEDEATAEAAEGEEPEVETIAASESGEAVADRVYKQSKWAWGWPLIPWAVLIAAQIFVIGGEPTFTLIFIVLAGIMTLPRYLRWRSTSYVVGSDGIKVTHQSASGSQDFEVEFNEVVSVEVERGFLDRTLGYKTIAILLEDRGLAKLTFVPVEADLDEVIQERLGDSE